MSDVASPDAAATGSEGAETGGKLSFMDKVKSKAKGGTQKLRSKLKPGSQGAPEGGSVGGDDSSSASSSDEEKEKDVPANNAMTGMTQPEFKKKLDEGDPSALAGGAQGTQGEKDTQETDLSRDFEGLSTKDEAPAPESESLDAGKSAEPKSEAAGTEKPVTEKLSDSFFGAKDAVAAKAGYGANSGETPAAVDEVKPSGETKEATSAYTDKAAGAASDFSGKASDKTSELTDKASKAAQGDSGNTEGLKNQAAETGQSWSAWAAEKVGYGKDVAAEKLPKTEDGTSAPDAAIGKAYEAKDVISQKTGEVTNAASAKAGEYQSSIPSDPAQRTYMQHAATHATAAKDSFVTNTTPGDHDKALSEKVTESIGNLPSILKSSLGFGGSAPTSPSTGSSVTAGDPAAPQSPSIVGRFTSMFAEKKPASSESSTATKEESSATD